MFHTKLTEQGFRAARQTSPLKNEQLAHKKTNAQTNKSYTRTTLNMH